MHRPPLPPAIKPLTLALALAFVAAPALAQQETVLADTVVLDTAEEALKQSLGVSVVTAEDIAKKPPANDISEIVRTMPGVNLTGNSSSGQRGNNRQIDLRGMGPENTLILVDGKPVSSRNSVRYGWRGERDTRGDSNWVPAEMVEKIEVIRGPAAARYGNGAAGGVVNIITKSVATEHHGQVTVYANAPQHSDEGSTRRLNFGLSGPIAEGLSYRVYGNVNKTNADDRDINDGHQAPGFATSLPSGREGVRNRDAGARLSWAFLPGQVLELDASYGRQSNIYAGDAQNVGTNAVVDAMVGRETNRMTRNNFSLTHKGNYDFGSSLSFVQYTKTENRRLQEGLVGATEGMFLAGTPPFVTSDLKDLVVHSEFNLPLRAGLNQMLTAGVEWTESRFDDPTSNTQAVSYGSVPGVATSGRSSKSESRIFSVFIEDNIELSSSTILTPGLRFDHHNQSGSNWSPALNLSHMIDERITLKAGIARAYKAPNLFQSNQNYLLYSASNGCANNVGTTGCYLVGNDNLDPETSINKEFGIEFKQGRLAASATVFRNDYRNKIQPGTTPYATTVQATNTRAIYQWSNIPKAVVSGLEGNLRLPVASTVDWNTNFTYMLESKNKTTGDYLSIIPKYTVNSSLDWQLTDTLGTLFTVTWYGQQKPMKYDYKGDPVRGTSADSVSPYAIASFSTTYTMGKHLKLTGGINNLFDKRQYRAGNSVGVTRGTLPDGSTGDTTALGAGAHTYNEPGRTLYVSLTSSF